jgi:hypothetical protein
MRTLSAGWDGEWERGEQQRLQRIIILENNYPFRRQRPLRLSISYEWTGWRSRLTQYREPVRFGGPIVIEKGLKVDRFLSLFLHSDLHLGRRRNISAHAQASVSVHDGETKTYGRLVGAHVWLSFFCNSIFSFPINNSSLYFESEICCRMTSVYYTK